jgi:Xaa-Pro aminopeptidase
MRSTTTQSKYQNRLKKLYSSLKDPDKNAILIFSSEDIYYLTGFYGKDSGSILIASPDKTYLLVNFIYYEQARSSVEDDIEVILYKGDRIKEASKILSSINIK